MRGRPKCRVCDSEVLHVSEYLARMPRLMRELAIKKLKRIYGREYKEKPMNIGYCPNGCGALGVTEFPLTLFVEIQKNQSLQKDLFLTT